MAARIHPGGGRKREIPDAVCAWQECPRNGVPFRPMKRSQVCCSLSCAAKRLAFLRPDLEAARVRGGQNAGRVRRRAALRRLFERTPTRDEVRAYFLGWKQALANRANGKVWGGPRLTP